MAFKFFLAFLSLFEIFGVEEVQWYAKILNLMFEQYFMPNRFCCQYFILVHCDNASPNSMNRQLAMFSSEFLTISYTGYVFYISAPSLIIFITHLLDISFEGLYRRYRLLCGNLWEGHWILHHANPFIFHGHVPLQLSI